MLSKRATMNRIVATGVSLPVGAMTVPYLAFFVPRTGGADGRAAQPALDIKGADVKASMWLKTHPVGDRSLTQGLRGDPTYLVVRPDGDIERYGINAVCTHLGCVVPWVAAEKRFKCPCHGSVYDPEGSLVRGPAPLPLALAHATVDGASDRVLFTTWNETDFRTGEDPWWR